MTTDGWDAEADVLVVGAGACGFAAAIAAADGGARVAMVEKGERLGLCNTALSTGSVPGAGSRFQREAGIDDSAERLYADLIRQSGPHDIPELAHRLALESASLVEWLVDEAHVDLRLITDYRHVGHSVERLHAPPSRRGKDLLDDLAGATADRGIEIAYGSPVVDLVTEGDAVTGVLIDGGRTGRARIRARKVILGTNGFAADPGLVRKYCPAIAGAPYFGAHGSTGEAVRWGERLGLRLSNMGSYQGYATVAYPQGSLLSWTVIEMGGVIVNARGERFGDETGGYSGFAANVLAEGRFVYSLFDTRIRDYVASHEEEFRELAHSSAMSEAASAQDVGARWSLPGDAVGRTLDRYERAAVGACADDHGRREFGMAPLRSPFVMVQAQAGLFHTQGGLWIDDEAHPCRTDGRRISNLFAGGGAAAGVSGRSGGAGYTSGAGLLTALGLGRIAGRAAAREIRCG